jgi:hypothetical protein
MDPPPSDRYMLVPVEMMDGSATYQAPVVKRKHSSIQDTPPPSSPIPARESRWPAGVKVWK